MRKYNICKINNIIVNQYEESSRNFNNHHDNKSPIGSYSNNEKIAKGGFNQTIDIGPGIEEISFKIYCLKDKKQAEYLWAILRSKRLLKFTCSYFGNFNVYIKSAETNEHITSDGRRIISITAIIQDEETVLPNEPLNNIDDFLDSLDINLDYNFEEFTKFKKGFHKVINTQGFLDYGDPYYALIGQSVHMVGRVPSYANKPINKIRYLEQSGSNVFANIQNIAAAPKDFLSNLKNLINVRQDFEIREERFEITEEDYDFLKDNIEKYKPFPIEFLELENIEQLSSKENENIKNRNLTKSIVNNIILQIDMQKLKYENFKTQEDLKRLIDDSITRIKNTNILPYEQSIFINYLQDFYNQNKLNKIETLNITNKQPLKTIIFNHYGHLDFYNDIILLNNFQNTDGVEGEILIFKK